MSVLSGSVWGPPPLPELLVAQLAEHGHDAADAAQCAADIFAQARTAPSASLFVELGAHSFLGGDIDGAIAAWRHALSSGEPQAAARALLNLGLLYEQLHLHDRAISVLASSSRYQRSPDSEQAQLALARCQHATADHEHGMETLARLAQSLMTEPDRTIELGQTLLALGDVAVEAGRFDRAERAWRAASATPDPATRSAAIDRVVRLLHELGHDDEIAGVLDDVSLARPHDAIRVVLERVALLAEVGRLDQARELMASVAGDGLGPNERFRLVDMRLRVGLVNPAIDELEELLKEADSDSRQRAAFNLAEIYRSHEMREPAQAMYRRVLDGGGYWAARAERAIDAAVVVPIGRPDDVPMSRAFGGAMVATAAGTEAGVDGGAADGDPDRDGTGADGCDDAVLDDLLPSAISGDSPPGVVEAVVDDVLSGADGGAVRTAAVPDHGHDAEPSFAEPSFAEPTTEPVIVLLSSVTDDEALEPAGTLGVLDHQPAGTAFADALGARGAGVDGTSEVGADRSDSRRLATRGRAADAGSDEGDASSFGNPDGDPNPYAALAPDPFEGDIAPSTRNPYAELAPLYTDISDSPADVAAEDWESLLDEWPDAPIEDQLSGERPFRSKTGIFSRYI